MAAHANPVFDDDENEYIDDGMDEFDREEAEMVAAGEIGQCRVCGCTDIRACEGGCIWAEVDLCSRCV